MLYSDVAHREYPQWIRLTVDGVVDLRLDVQQVIHAHDLLDDVPVVRSRFVKPILNRIVGRPGYFRFDSTFELTVTLDGVTRTETGRTLHELVALH